MANALRTAGPSTVPQTAALLPTSLSQTKRLSTNPSTSPSKPTAGGRKAVVKDVVSPGELCGFVDTLLAQLEGRFDEMSEQVLGRMNEMSTRIDNLENAIQDLMTGGIETPSPSPAMIGGKRA